MTLLGLIRRDHAFRVIWPWCLMGIIVSTIGMTVVRDVMARRGSLDIPLHDSAFAIVAVAVWFLVAFYLLYGNVAARGGRFHLSLPIPVRRLWLSHLLSLVLGMSAIFAVALAFVAARNGLAGVRPLVSPLIVITSLRVVSVLVLALGLVQLLKPGLQEIPMRPTTVAYLVVVGAFDLIVLVAISRVPPVFAVIPLAIGLGVLAFVYLSLPASLSIVPREPERGLADVGRAAPVDTGAAATATAFRTPGGSAWGAPDEWSGARAAPAAWVAPARAAGRRRRRLVHRTVLGLLMRHWGVWLYAPWALFIGFYLSGAWPDGMSGPVFVAVAWACMNGPFVHGVGRLQAIDHLPVSRRLFFAYLTIPAFAVVVIGLALGSFVGRGVIKEDWLWDRFLRIEGRPERAVPYDFLEIAWDGEPPPVTSPWGEEHEPWRRSVFGQSDVVVYRPYDTPPGASREFIAHQIGRALRAVYGSGFPADEVERRYVEGSAEAGRIHWAEWHRLVGDCDRTPAGRGSLLPLMIAVVGVPWFLFVKLALWAAHGAVSKARRALPTIAMVSAVAVFTVGVILVAAMTDLVSGWVVTAFAWIVLRNAAQAVPGGAPVLWMLCVGALAASYLSARAQFLRSEAPITRRGE
jgi:hypothetical protein